MTARASGVAKPLGVIAVLVIAASSATSSDGAMSICAGTHSDRATPLEYEIKMDRAVIVAGAPLVVTGVLTNTSQRPAAVAPPAMFRYINHEKAPTREGEFGSGGQLIGDDAASPPESVGVKTIAPGESLSRTLDLSRLRIPVFAEPGEYKLSVDYCYFGRKKVGRTSAPIGCVRSNEIEFKVSAK